MDDEEDTCNHIYCRELVMSSRIPSYLPCQTGEHIRGEHGEYTFNFDYQEIDIFSLVGDWEMQDREGFPTREEILAAREQPKGLIGISMKDQKKNK